MRCATTALLHVLALLCLSSLRCAAIEITNEDFDVKRGEDFEITWEDAGGNRVDIDLYEWPIRAHVEALSRGQTQYVKEYSRTVLISEDIEPRMYCFGVVDWPSGQTDYSDGFFFNGTGEAVTTTTSSGPTPTLIPSGTSSSPGGGETNTPGPDDGDDNNNNNPPTRIITRSREMNPLLVALLAVGGTLFIGGVIWVSIDLYRGYKKRKKQAAAKAEGGPADGDAAAVREVGGAGGGQAGRPGQATVGNSSTKEQPNHDIREYYSAAAMGQAGVESPSKAPQTHEIREYYSGAETGQPAAASPPPPPPPPPPQRQQTQDVEAGTGIQEYYASGALAASETTEQGAAQGASSSGNRTA